jgi:hypothetical protein
MKGGAAVGLPASQAKPSGLGRLALFIMAIAKPCSRMRTEGHGGLKRRVGYRDKVRAPTKIFPNSGWGLFRPNTFDHAGGGHQGYLGQGSRYFLI